MAAPTDELRDRSVDLLYSEILAKDSLIYYLTQSGCPLASLTSLQQQELINLYNKVVLPWPQRHYRATRRGKRLHRLQHLANQRLRKSTVEETIIGKKLHISERSSDSQHDRLNVNSKAVSRLKPPPAASSGAHKLITLGGSLTQSRAEELKLKRQPVAFSSNSSEETVCHVSEVANASKTSDGKTDAELLMCQKNQVKVDRTFITPCTGIASTFKQQGHDQQNLHSEELPNNKRKLVTIEKYERVILDDEQVTSEEARKKHRSVNPAKVLSSEKKPVLKRVGSPSSELEQKHARISWP